MAGRTAGDTNSRIGSRGHMKRTESAILNDPDIWNMSDSDLESQARDEEEEMARYLVEQAPSAGGGRSTIPALRRKTAGERELILKRERAVKGLCELAILRCLRPDHLLEGLDRLVRQVLDPEYYDFAMDIQAPLRAKKTAGLGGGQKGAMSAVELSKKILGQSKMNSSKMSATGDSQNGANQTGLQANATAGSRLNPGGPSGQMNETNKSGAGMTNTQYTTSSKQRITREEQERIDREAREKRGGLNNVRNLIAEAYGDSDARSPILFLVTHSVNIFDLVTEFHQKRVPGSSSLKLQYFSLGKGLEAMVEEKLSKAAQNGDWIILENLHLVEDWLPTFEEKISKWKGAELNSRFRMWLSCVPVDSFPINLLEKSIKVALQPPKTVKQKMERMLLEQEKEAFFRKSGR